MKNKYIKQTLAVLLLAFLWAAGGLYFFEQKGNDVKGALVFAESYNAGTKVDRIEVGNQQNKITLVLENGGWRVAEADYYYAHPGFVAALLEDLNQARLYRPQEKEPQPEKGWTSIKVFAGNKLLNSVEVGDKTPNQRYNYLKRDAQGGWLVEGKFQLPRRLYSWMQQPLTAFPPSLFEAVEIVENGESRQAKRESELQEFLDAEGRHLKMTNLLQVFEFLNARGAQAAQNFDDSVHQKLRKIVLTTFSGMVITADLYQDAEKNYWLKLSFSTTHLPTVYVNDYIKENSYLYEGWYFKISPEAGEKLALYDIDRDI